jgi:hypothetical protein
MKAVILLSLVLSAFAAQAAIPPIAPPPPRAITFTNALITKQFPSADGNFLLVVNRDTAEWCTGHVCGLDLNSFPVAQALEGLADGIYSCDGQFVAQPGTSRCQVYALSNCRAQDPNALRSSCPSGH